MKNNQMEIKLKEIMDKQGMTLDELKRNVQIDAVLLDVMYNEGLSTTAFGSLIVSVKKSTSSTAMAWISTSTASST